MLYTQGLTRYDTIDVVSIQNSRVIIITFPSSQILDGQFAEPVFTLAEEMLRQWSKQILEAWIGIFAKLLPVLARR